MNDVRNLLFKHADVVDRSLLSKIYDAWNILTGSALAVEYPCMALNETEIVLLAHENGMHARKKVYISNCYHCFTEGWESYEAVCVELLTLIGEEKEILAFKEFLKGLLTSGPFHEQGLVFHEHELYMVGNFLGYDHTSPKFKEFEVKYDMARIKRDREKDKVA